MFKLKYLILFLPFLFVSCVDEDAMLGNDLVDPSDRINVSKYNNFDITAAIFHEGDSLKTSDYRYMVLGSYKDNTFGKVTASIYTQLSLSSTNIDFNFYKDSVQSIVLSLAYVGSFSKDTSTKTMNMRIEIYRLSEDIKDSVAYYSNSSLNYSDLIKDTTLTISPKEMVQVGEDTNKLPPHLRLDLGKNFLNTIINSGSFANNKEFKDFFKGLYIKLTPASDPNGMIAYIDMYSSYSGVVLYYKKNGKLQNYNLIFGSNSRRFANIKYDFSSTPLSTFPSKKKSPQDTIHCNDSIGNSSKIYLGTLGISIAKLNINDLMSWYNTSLQNLGVFNQAMLILPVSEDYLASVGENQLPAKIICYRKDYDGKLVYIHDAFSQDHFMGIYDNKLKAYKMRITSHLQNYLNGNIKTPGLYLIPDNRTSTANRVVLNGPKHKTNPAKIEIIYTR